MTEFVTPKGLKVKLPQTIAGSFKPSTIIEGVKMTQVGSPRSAVFMKCVLLKTNDELLIYQKRLFSKKCSLRFYIKFTTEKEGVNLNMKKSFFKGYLSFTVNPTQIECIHQNGKYAYTLPLPETSWLTHGQRLTFTLLEKIIW